MTREEMENLGFEIWELVDFHENQYYDDIPLILLIPKDKYDLIPNGSVMYSISGEKVVKGSREISMNTDGSCLAYGVAPDDKED